MKKTILRMLGLLLAAVCCVSLALPAAAIADPFYSVVSPVGAAAVEKITQAPRLDTLAGKTVALVGHSFNAATTMEALREKLQSDYPTIKILTSSDVGTGGVYSVFHQSEQTVQFQQKLKELGVDAVVSGNCGCGLCTLKESGSSIAAEYIGIPTVTVGAGRFLPEIASTGYNRGVPVLRTAEYPGAFASDTREELRSKTLERVYPEVVAGLTTAITQEEIDRCAGLGEVDYNDILIAGTNDTLQEYFRQAGYTDGLPIGLPTREKIAEYLEYTPYQGSDVLGVYPLAYRECRAYTVAANAVMAGCPPEYMPLCIAFVKCMGDGEWRRPLASTHGWSPYAWLNGPVARQLGIDCGQGMISETANRSLARFIDLAMLNIGGYYVKENRMGTFGYLSPWVFAEDEEACARVGWSPYHVANGYGWNDNTITAASALSWGNNVTPATSDAAQIVKLIAWDVTEKEQNGLGNTNPQVWRTVFLTEPVAADLAKTYRTKSAVEDALIEQARRPLWLRTYANYWANTGSNQYTRRTLQQHYDMLMNDPAEKAAVTAVPDWLKPLFPTGATIATVATMLKGQTPILICGDGDRNKSQVMPGGGYVTVKIELPQNWDALMEEKGYEPLSAFYLEERQSADSSASVRVKLSEKTVGAEGREKTVNAAVIYTAGGSVGKVEYQLPGAAWTEGTVATSTDAITSLLIRVTEANGTVTVWKYQDGTVTKQ